MRGPVRVLYVTDVPDYADLTATALEDEDDRFTVETVTSASDGLDRLTDEIDCIVSDYDLPGMNGIEFFEAVREEYPDLPFILFTASDSEQVASEAIGAGVTDYYRRSSDPEQHTLLANRITNAVEQFRARRELKRERDRFVTLFESLPNPVVQGVVVDGEPIIRRVNPAFEETFGYDADDVVGENLDDLTVPEDKREQAAAINEKLAEEGQLRTEVTRQTADGLRDFVIDVVIQEEDGSAEGYSIYTDITERKQRQRELERQNERLEKFASIVSHELRNPLTVAAGRLELAREDCDSEHLDHVADALDRSETLIDDLLAVAREGEKVNEMEPVDLSEAVEDCWQTVRTGAARLVVDTDRTIRADPGRLQQLLENLVSNAVEHGDDAVTVTVGYLDDGSGFYVEDDGPGIPDEARDRIFEFGYSTSREGTGLGLAIVREIAAAHDWEITVTDGADGGARFEITGVDTHTAGRE